MLFATQNPPGHYGGRKVHLFLLTFTVIGCCFICVFCVTFEIDYKLPNVDLEMNVEYSWRDIITKTNSY